MGSHAPDDCGTGDRIIRIAQVNAYKHEVAVLLQRHTDAVYQDGCAAVDAYCQLLRPEYVASHL